MSTEGEPQRVPAGQALPGVELYPLPAGVKIIAAHLFIKAEDADGHVQWYTRGTDEYNNLEFLGAMLSYTDYMRQVEATDWQDDENAPDGT